MSIFIGFLYVVEVLVCLLLVLVVMLQKPKEGGLGGAIGGGMLEASLGADAGNVLIKTTAEQKFLPTRCGFTWDIQNATAKELRIVHLAESEVTAIKNVTMMKNADDNIYDLNGRKVSQNSKGLLIQNGKKTVVK